MGRRKFDGIVSAVGAGLTVFLLAAAALLNWGYSFANQSVTDQLSAQKISFPAADSESLKALPEDDRKAIEPFAGLQLTTGEQAEAYAMHYIGSHVKNVAGGKTYSEISGEALAKSAEAKANPSDTALAAEAATLMGQRQTLFMGETLKGLLLNAFAFWQVGQIAMYAAIACLAGGILMLILTLMGYAHLRRTPREATI
ncbi:MAG: hypothetical protein F2538_00980 [Actinobacteria bacterium]|jgi:hypothetical protein|uniref:Unannotated protein n=1 Tax=freshwater metagenome TaxID=449393 RepID=A0A6J6C6Q1_9ZZZZ|nr:hypothetical protein [Actinomycetota bacterium]